MKVDIASLDLFWMNRLQLALALLYDTRLLTTWTLKRPIPNDGLPVDNAYFLHYLLQIYKMVPGIQFGNHTYYHLCKAFDIWLRSRARKDADLLIVLSGMGLDSMRLMHRRGKAVVVESGSTHTDFQHHIVSEEYRRNGINKPLFPKCYRERLKLEFREADFLQVPSDFVKRTYLEQGVEESKILLAPYGADTSRFQPRSRAEMGNVFRVICPSGVNLRKGARVLVEAWRKLAWSDAELHWVGQPGNETEHLFKEHTPGIVWHDWMPQDQLSTLYRSCDVMALPSFEEGFARVMVEGAASALPLIVTPNTGIENFFTPDNPEGWLIPCNDVEALCAALLEAKQNRDETFEIGQRAAQRAAQGFTWQAYAGRVRENIRHVIS